MRSDHRRFSNPDRSAMARTTTYLTRVSRVETSAPSGPGQCERRPVVRMVEGVATPATTVGPRERPEAQMRALRLPGAAAPFQVDDRHILAVVLVAVVQLLGAATGAHGPGPERPAPPLRVYGPPPVAGSAPCMLLLSGERSGPRPALVEAGAITGNGLSAALSAPGLETTPDTLPECHPQVARRIGRPALTARIDDPTRSHHIAGLFAMSLKRRVAHWSYLDSHASVQGKGVLRGALYSRARRRERSDAEDR